MRNADFIKIGDENKPIFFGLGAIEEYNLLAKQNFQDTINGRNISVTIMAYVGFKWGMMSQDQDPGGLRLFEVGQWLEEGGENLVTKIMDIYVKSLKEMEKKMKDKPAVAKKKKSE